MQTLIELINRYLTVVGVPGTRVLATAVIITLAVVFKRLFSRVILHYARRLLHKVQDDLDDTFIEQFDRPIGWLIILGGLWVTYITLVTYLNPELAAAVRQLLEFAFVVVIAVAVYRASVGLTELVRELTLHTKTELDNLIVPYIPKFVQIVAILVVSLKSAEIFFGMSVAALAGLLGGAGLTLGLILKDMAADWLASIFIFADHMYREGDLIELSDGELGHVESVGMKSTRVRLQLGAVVRIANSQMLAMAVRNWTQAPNWQVEYDLRLDGISTDKLRTVIEGMREILAAEDLAHADTSVHLSQLDGNTRVIKIEYYPNGNAYYNLGQLDDGPYLEHFNRTVEQVNLAILTLLETHQIDHLAYMLFKNVRNVPTGVKES